MEQHRLLTRVRTHCSCCKLHSLCKVCWLASTTPGFGFNKQPIVFLSTCARGKSFCNLGVWKVSVILTSYGGFTLNALMESLREMQ
jgi:hypothetical protein